MTKKTSKINKNLLISTLLIVVILCLISINIYVRWQLPAKEYIDYVEKYSKEYSLEKELVLSIIKAESNFDKNALSTKNARGLMQLLPSTAKFIADMNNIEFDNDELLYDPNLNIQLGCAYFGYLLKKFNNVDHAILAYNGGEGNVKEWLKNAQKTGELKVPFKETKDYLEKINSNYKFYKKLSFF